MIYVDKEHFKQIEYLLGQSAQGNHVLFAPEVLRKALCKEFAGPGNEEEAYAAEPHIERLLKLPSLEQKRAYLDHLPPDTLENLVRAYFNIVENSLYENLLVKH